MYLLLEVSWGSAHHAGTLTALMKTTRMFPVASVKMKPHLIQFNTPNNHSPSAETSLLVLSGETIRAAHLEVFLQRNSPVKEV